MARKKVNTTESVSEEEKAAMNTEEVQEELVEEVTPAPTTKKKATTASASAEKNYNAEDLVPCRSITQGRLLMTGPRSGILYVWYNAGDLIDIEYQDLTALMLSRSKYLTIPLFVIEDEELLDQPRWEYVKEVYENLVGIDDYDSILNLPPAQLKKALEKMPTQLQRTLAVEVSTRIENGTYDSINRIKAFDEVCGTDLMCLIS